MLLIKQLKTTNNLELKKRLYKSISTYGVVLCVALIYLIFTLCTGIGIPCLFYKITGFKCVGCGISRMFIALAKLDIYTAFTCNPFLFVTGPFIIAYLVVSEVRYVRDGSRRMGKWEIFMWVEIALAIAYGILRNIFPI